MKYIILTNYDRKILKVLTSNFEKWGYKRMGGIVRYRYEDDNSYSDWQQVVYK